MPTYWTVADSDWVAPSPEERSAGWRWRHRVDVAVDPAGPDDRLVRVAFSVTAPKENHAAVLSPTEALSAVWAADLGRAGGTWLVPWLHRLEVSTRATAAAVHRDLLAEVARRTGLAPTSYDWDA